MHTLNTKFILYNFWLYLSRKIVKPKFSKWYDLTKISTIKKIKAGLEQEVEADLEKEVEADLEKEVEADLENPGVYLLAHFEQKTSGKADYTSDGIVYIGETTRQTIKIRLTDFYKSAFTGKQGHSGGETYYDKFPPSKTANKQTQQLYVAILPVAVNNKKERKAYIKYIERLAIWDFVKTHNKYPACNSE